jgi:hypothetical protein
MLPMNIRPQGPSGFTWFWNAQCAFTGCLPKARIASYILLLAEMQDSRSITLPVPRKELAIFLGMTHETLYRSTREPVKEGLVRFAGITRRSEPGTG